MCPAKPIAALLALALFLPSAFPAQARETDGPLPVLELRGAHDIEREGEVNKDWYVFFAMVNAYPKLEREALIKDLFNPAMKLIAPGHKGAKTISDLRDDHLLWPPHIGMGRALSKRWGFMMQAGYSAGKVRTNTLDASWLLFPLTTDLEIYRSAFYAGVGLDYYPFGMAEQKEYENWWHRLRAARPSLGARLTITHASFKAKVKVGFNPFGNVVSLKLSDSWTLPSVNTNIGLDIPVNKRNTITLNAGLNFFWEEEQDFEGSAFTIAWRHYLK